MVLVVLGSLRGIDEGCMLVWSLVVVVSTVVTAVGVLEVVYVVVKNF